MKKCLGCQQEIDKYAIACEYCGKLTQKATPENEKKNKTPDTPPKSTKKS